MQENENDLERALTQVADALDALARGDEVPLLSLDVEAAAATRLRTTFQRLTEQVQRAAAKEQAETALRQQQRDLEIIFNTAPIMIWYKDTENRILRLNPTAASSMGRTVEEVQGRSVYDLHAREEAERYYQDDLEVIRSGQPKLGIVEELVTPAGERRWIRTDKVPYYDDAGALAGVVVISQDITAQRQAEEALRRSRDELEVRVAERTAALSGERSLLRAIIDNLPMQIFVKDAQSRFILGSPSVLNQLGAKTMDEIVGKTDFDFHPPELAEQYYADEQVIIQNNQPLIGEEQQAFDKSLGGLRWLLTTKVPVRDAQGRVTGLVGINQDITERKLAEIERERLAAEVRRSADLLRSVIDATPDWIFIKDQRFRYILVNQGYADGLRLDPEAMIGKDDLELGFPEELVFGDPDKGIRGFRTEDIAVLKGGETIINPHDLVTIDGETRTFHTFKTPLRDADENIIGVLSVARDITERQQLLETVQRRSVQLETGAEVSQVASSILNLAELQQRVVDLIRERFGFYYVGLFLLDRSGRWTGEPERWALLCAGTGEAGRRMLEQGHKLEVGGESMVGWCMANARARVSLDVGEEAVRFDNPLLPDTRSEMALPLLARGRVIGALTIQSSAEAAFSDEDVAALQIMANQIANAIENVRLFEEARARAASEEMLNRVGGLLQEHNDVEAMLHVALRELGLALGAKRARARLSVKQADGTGGRYERAL